MAAEDGIDLLAENLEPAPAGQRESLLSGTVAWTSGEPGTVTPVAGTLNLSVWWDDDGVDHEVPVAGGRFALEVLRDAKGNHTSLDGETCYGNLYVQPLQFVVGTFRDSAGRPGVCCTAEGDLKDPMVPLQGRFGTADITLWVRRLRPVILHVVDSESREDLSAVQLLRSSAGGLLRFAHPAAYPDIRYRQSAPVPRIPEFTSPVSISPEPEEGQVRGAHFLVGAEGYGWERVRLNLTDSGSQTVELGPCGNLEVVLKRPLPARLPVESVLRVFRDGDGALIHEGKPHGESPLRLDSIPVGAYSAVLELGPHVRPAFVHGEARGVVMRGAATVLELTLDPAPEVETASVAGTLFVDPAWGFDSFWLTLTRVKSLGKGRMTRAQLTHDQMTPSEGQRGHFSFEMGPLQIGEYVAEVESGNLDWKMIFELRPEGVVNLHVALPSPVDVTADVVDDATGERLPLKAMFWHAAWPSGSGGGTLEEVWRSPSDGLFHLRAPEGPIRFEPWEESLEAGNLKHDAKEGAHLVARFRRPNVCEIQFSHDGALVELPEGYDVELEPIGGVPSFTWGRALEFGTAHYGVSRPGRYRIELPQFESFAPLDPIEVDFLEGETIIRRLELVPR